jgi:polyadenylate-binding protein
MNNQFQVVVPHNQSGETGRTVLWVSELPENITEMDLEQFFQDYKESILVIQINRGRGMMDSFVPRSLTATVIFKDHKRADDARRGLNLRKLRGKTIRIMWHEKDNSQRYNNQGNLFIKNIALDVKPREFYEQFLQFGDILSAKVCEDEEGNHNGYGYVSYYSPESADRAIQALDEKEVWSQIVEVKRFQKKNERLNALITNKNIYVKNLPLNYTEIDVKNLFLKFGNITWAKNMIDNKGRKSAIVAFDSEDSTKHAIEGMKNFTLDGNELYVETLMKKSDRKKLLSSRINDSNWKLNTQFKNCNLHIRNLPYDVNEEYLHQVFSKYGEIKSVKIPKYILVTKVANEFKEQEMSKGFGYVCFTEQENAKKAIEELNGKILPNYENWKRPLLIDIFMPKHERNQFFSRFQQQYNQTGKQQLPILNPIISPYGRGSNFNMNLQFHPNLMKHIRHPQMVQPGVPTSFHPHMKSKPQQIFVQHRQPQNVPAIKSEDPDVKYLESLEDESAKRDYLGEFIFKKIENHPYAQSHNFTIDTIGKITGMILGIDDLNEIVDITLNHDNLTARITEALTLLEGQSA